MPYHNASALKLKIHLDSVFTEPWHWRRISRSEACLLYNFGLVASIDLSFPTRTAHWFDEHNTYFMGNSPYDYNAVHYYEYVGGIRTDESKRPKSLSAFRKALGEFFHPDEVDSAQAEKERTRSLNSASWVSSKEDGEKDIETAAIGDTVYLKVDTEGLPVADRITFSVYRDGKESEEHKVVLLTGYTGRGREDDAAVAKWVIPPQTKSGPIEEGTELQFMSRQFAHKLECRSPKLKVGPQPFRVWVEIDVEAETAQDDTLILLDASGNEVHRIPVADLQETEEDYVCLSLPDLDMDTKYTLLRDLGPDEGGGRDSVFADKTPKELLQQ